MLNLHLLYQSRDDDWMAYREMCLNHMNAKKNYAIKWFGTKKIIHYNI